MGFVRLLRGILESIFCSLTATVTLIPNIFLTDIQSQLFFTVHVAEKVGMLSYSVKFPFLKLSEKFLIALIRTQLMLLLRVDGVTCFLKQQYPSSGKGSAT